MRKSFLALIAGGLIAALAASAQPTDGALYEGLKARAIGPAGMSGRITDIVGLASDPNRMLVGAATGGVWMTENGGLTWTPVFDDQPVASIGAVAINQSNPDILWVGTGEGNVRNSTSIGDGVYKSVDGGRSWTNMGLKGVERINRITLDPANPDIVYVAALGALWGENADRGIYKTTDGGSTWSKILYVDRTTGGTDIRIDPKNPNKLFAAMWQFRRKPFEFKSGGPGSGLYVSHDGGASWKRFTEEDGLPKGDLGRMALAIAPSDPSRVYALVEAEKSALIRSDDGGHSWKAVNSETNISVRPFYYSNLRVDPENPDRVYNVESRVRLSIDGGKTFQYIDAIDCCAPSNTIHIDVHAMWINPKNPSHLAVGNDGGLAISQDKGATWRFVRNLPLAQFYHVAVDDAEPYHVYGGLQDNGSWRGPSEVWQDGGIRNHHWQEVGFGDGFDTIPDPENPRAGYAMSQGGFLFRYDLDTGEQRLIRPDPKTPETELRFNWNSGFAQDPFDPATIWYGSQFVHRSRDRGLTWETLSDDLTTNDPERQTFRESGGLTYDVTAAENHTTITVIAPNLVERGVVWVGTDDGRVHVSRDDGASFKSVESKARGVEKGAWVPFIEPSPHDPSVAYVVFDDHRRSDMAPHVYKATGFGEKFERIVDEKDVSGYALSIRQDPVDPDLLFLGTEFGLWVSLDGGKDWRKWTAGVPTVSVMDIAIQKRESDLVLGTHGRALFVIDDYGALRNRKAADWTARFRLLDVTDGQQYQARGAEQSRFPGSGEFRAENEPYGVMLTFFATGEDLKHPDPEKERARAISERAARKTEAVKEEQDSDDKADKDKGKVTITVADASGVVIRTFKADIHQGLNRVVWDLRRDGVAPPPPAKPREDGTLPSGPEVPPGPYKATLRFDGIEQSADIRVLADPRLDLSDAAYRARDIAAQNLLSLQKTMRAAIVSIHEARRDIDTLLALAKVDGDEDAHKELKTRAKKLKDQLDALEKRFRAPPDTKGIVYDDDKVSSKLGLAGFFVNSTLDAPSKAANSYIAHAEATLEAALSDLNRTISEDIAGLREAFAASGLGLLGQQPVGAE